MSERTREDILETLGQPRRQMVVALGGNAISLDTEEGNIDQQFWHSRDTARLLAPLIQAGHKLTITHGNGPQVGAILRRVEIASKEVYPISLTLAVADTQAGMGYMIGQCLQNELMDLGEPDRRIYTLVTCTLVDPQDPDFTHPSKPIGSWMDAEAAKKHQEERGWNMREVKPGRWRRVVPSPEPLEILEEPLIKRLAKEGELMIVCGGGGVPVQRTAERRLEGVDAVIDKDKASSLLALTLEVDLFIILTAVDRVCLHYEKPNQQSLDFISAAELRKLQKDGHFPSGSMGPKVEAVCRFVERSQNPKALAVITSIARVDDALKGLTGTVVYR
jgi:carbamate kinase